MSYRLSVKDFKIQRTGASDNSILKILTGTSGTSQIYFGDSVLENIGSLKYNHVTDTFSVFGNSNERITILSSGNVGINTLSPAAKLHVENATNTGTATDNCELLVKSVNRTGFISLDGTSTGTPSVIFRNSGVEKSRILYSNSSDYLTISTATLERLRIDSSGNVGIGFTAPRAKLHLVKTASTTAYTQSAAYLHIGGTADIAVGSTHLIGFGYDDGVLTNQPAYMGYLVESVSGVGGGWGSFVFGTRSVGTDTQPTERMRITNSGQLLFNTVTTSQRLLVIQSATGTSGAGGIRLLADTLNSDNATIEAIGQRSDSNTNAGFSGRTLLSRINTTPAALTSGIPLGQIGFGGSYDGTLPNVVYSAAIVGMASGTWSVTSAPSDIVFYTTPAATAGIISTNVSSNIGIERMRIASNGSISASVADTLNSFSFTSGTGILSYASFSTSSFLQNNQALTFGTTSAASLIFRTNSVDRITISSAGLMTATAGLTLSGGNLTVAAPNISYLGGANGNSVSPTSSNTNVVLYNISGTNWSGIGSDTGGSMYFVTGTSVPSTKALLDPNGNLGIGLVPSTKVDVNGNLRVTAVTPTTGAVIMRANASNQPAYMQWVNNANTVERGWMVVDESSNFGLATGSTQRVWIDSAGNFGVGSTAAIRLYAVETLQTQVGFRVHATHASFNSEIAQVISTKANATDFNLLACYSSGGGDYEFKVRGDGVVFSDGGTAMSTPADYAEMFEWLDGNPNSEDRVGMTVSLIGNKIKVAELGETIIGVVSGNPSVLGDSAWNKWSEKYLKDKFNRYIKDQNGFRILNPDFDSQVNYIPRIERKEWSPVGLMGKLRIKKNQLMNPYWIFMRDISEDVAEYLIR